LSSHTFADLGISSTLARVLAAQGIERPFAIQSLVIPDVLAGHDVLAKAPTGSGKTLGFGAPLIDRIDPRADRPAALVLAPTRELAVQIVDAVRPLADARDLAIAAVYGGVGITAQARKARRAHMLVATPGRLLDLMGRGDVNLGGVRMLVLDEADRMLDMGFRPDVDRIVSQTPKKRQTLFFSATLDGATGKIAKAYTNEPRRHAHEPKPGSEGKIEHRFVGVSAENKLDAVIGEIRQTGGGRTLVFVRTKHGADRLAKKLGKHGLQAEAMHGNKSQSQRMRALAKFENGHLAALVATDVAARGIDVEGIDRVVNFDPPHDHQAYTHRVGRTGRAGADGVGVTLVLGGEERDVAQIVRSLDLPAGTAHGPLASRVTSSNGGGGAPRNGPRRNRSRNRNRRQYRG
jgi:superfamily II DNA/RNA helicase